MTTENPSKKTHLKCTNGVYTTSSQHCVCYLIWTWAWIWSPLVPFPPLISFHLPSFTFLTIYFFAFPHHSFHLLSIPGSHFCLFSPSSCFFFFPFITFSFSSCFPLTSFILFPLFPAHYFLLFPLFTSLSLFLSKFPLLSSPLLSFPFLSIYLNLFSLFLSSQCSSQFFFRFLSFLSSLSSLSFHILLSCSYSFPNTSVSSLSFFFFFFTFPVLCSFLYISFILLFSFFISLSCLLTLQLNWNTWLTWQMKIPNACHSYFSIPHPLAFIACPQHRSIHLLTKWWRHAALSAAAAAHGESSIHLGPNCVNISFSLNGQNRLEL